MPHSTSETSPLVSLSFRKLYTDLLISSKCTNLLKIILHIIFAVSCVLFVTPRSLGRSAGQPRGMPLTDHDQRLHDNAAQSEIIDVMGQLAGIRAGQIDMLASSDSGPEMAPERHK